MIERLSSPESPVAFRFDATSLAGTGPAFNRKRARPATSGFQHGGLASNRRQMNIETGGCAKDIFNRARLHQIEGC